MGKREKDELADWPARRYLISLADDSDACARLAVELDIQTDPGESPASVIQSALRQVSINYRADWYKHKLAQLGPDQTGDGTT